MSGKRKAVTQWSPNQQHLMLWLATPEDARTPKEQKALAEQLSVREATLSDWKHLAGFGDAVMHLTRTLIRASEMAEIIFAQVRKAKSGDTQAAKFVLEVVGQPDIRAQAEMLKDVLGLEGDNAVEEILQLDQRLTLVRRSQGVA